MNISTASRAAGLPVKTVRYYADIGLVSAPSCRCQILNGGDPADAREPVSSLGARAFP